MEQVKKIVAVAEGNFPFKFYIEKAEASGEESSELELNGVASSANIDHDNERMAPEALHQMARIINEKGVPLRVEHQKGDDAIIGTVVAGEVDDRNQLKIKTIIDKKSSIGRRLHEAIKNGTKMGFSVGGDVVRAYKEFVEGAGTAVKTFYNVLLNEVSVTPRPANYDAYIFNKSIANPTYTSDELTKAFPYQAFIFENPHIDYLESIAKSVPERAWKKVDNSYQEQNIMTKNKKDEVRSLIKALSDEMESSDSGKEIGEAEKDGSAEKNPTAIESILPTVSSTEETKSSTKTMNKNVDNLIKRLVKTLTYNEADAPALDSEQPNESKELKSVDTKKQREGQENTYAEGDNGTERETGAMAEGEKAPVLEQEMPEQGSSETAIKSMLAKAIMGMSKAEVLKLAKELTSEESESKPKVDTEKADAKEDTGTTTDNDWFDSKKSMKPSSFLNLIKNINKEASKYLKATETEGVQGERERNPKETGDEVPVVEQEMPTENTTEEKAVDEGKEEGTEKDVSDSEAPDTRNESRTVGDEVGGTFEAAEESEDSSSEYGEKYTMPTIQRAISDIGKVAKELQRSDKLSKSVGFPKIDIFAATVQNALNVIGGEFAKSQTRVLGLEGMLVEQITSNKELQKSIKEWSSVPEAKKSVVMGNAYVTDRDGVRYKLTAETVNAPISKSEKPKVDFKELYQSEFSSVANGESLTEGYR